MKRIIELLRHYAPGMLLVLILCIASYLRLYNIGNYLTFLGDEGRDVLVVKRMIIDHKFTLLGPTASVGGFFLGPIYYYFMIPFLWAWKLDPVGPAVMVGLFGVATVYLVYRTGKSFFGEIAGLVAASLYAVSPLVIAYSRSSWNPNVVPFFSILLIYLLGRLKAREKTWDPLWIGITLGIGIQLHYLFLFLYIVVFVWYLTIRRLLQLDRTIFWTVVGILIGASPFVAFELRHGFANTKTILQFIFTGKETGFLLGSFLATIDDVTFRLFSRLVFRIPPKELWNGYPHWYITFLITISYVVRGVVILSGIFIIGRKPAKSVKLLCAWLIPVVILFGFYRRAIYDYYFGIVFAAPFLLLGLFFKRAWTTRISKFFVAVLWIGLLVFNWQGRPFIYPPNNQLLQVKTIAKIAFDQTEGKSFNFALVADGNSDHAYRYFFEIWGNPPVIIQNNDIDPERKSVTNQLIVICETIDCKPLGHPLWEIAGFGKADITGSWDAPFVKIFKLVHVQE